jgi:hypothetical protein
MKDPKATPPGRGWITPIVEFLIFICTSPTRLVFPHRSRAQNKGTGDIAFHNNRAMRVDTYVATCFIFEILSLFIVARFRETHALVCWVVISLVKIRVIGIPAVSLEIAMKNDTFVLSRSRMVVLTIVNFLELMVSFAVFYTFVPSNIGGADKMDGLAALHLSAVSQLTIGYGDVYPKGWLRPLTWCQGIFTLIVLGVAFSRYVGALGSIKDLQNATSVPPEGAGSESICETKVSDK